MIVLSVCVCGNYFRELSSDENVEMTTKKVHSEEWTRFCGIDCVLLEEKKNSYD